MRLIDADKIYPDSMTKDGKIAISQSQLANASTVPLPDFKEGYKQAILDGKANFSRPQGEWIAREDMDYLDENKVVHNHFECNKCGLIHDFIDGHTSQYNFCPNCGAAMKGENTDS